MRAALQTLILASLLAVLAVSPAFAQRLAVEKRGMAAGGPAHAVWTYDYQRSLEQVPGDESAGINAGGGDDNQQKNHRLTYRKTVYHDDGGRYKDMRSSDFDGLGHHRVKTYGGNFSSQDPKSVTVDYNGPLGSAFTLPASSDPWILGTWTEHHRRLDAIHADRHDDEPLAGAARLLRRGRQRDEPAFWQ